MTFIKIVFRCLLFVAIFWRLSLYPSISHAASIDINKGASIYASYCALCHGDDGLGEGLLSMRFDKYPTTNLVAKGYQYESHQQLQEVIAWGGFNSQLKLDNLMPPYKDELSKQEISLVAKFVLLLRSHNEEATIALKKTVASGPLRASAGRDLFKVYCVLCHGKTGMGDGRMAKVMKLKNIVPPANLVVSRLNSAQMYKIISKGGSAVGRSSFMPPWELKLSARQLNAVIKYITSLRSSNSTVLNEKRQGDE